MNPSERGHRRKLFQKVFESAPVPEQQPGLVPADAGHVAGGDGQRRRAERDEDFTGQTGINHEGRDDTDGPADRAERAGQCRC